MSGCIGGSFREIATPPYTSEKSLNDSNSVRRLRTIWVIGLNPTDSVASKKDEIAVLVYGVKLATSLDSKEDRVVGAKVFQKVEVFLPEDRSPDDENETFVQWNRLVQPFPVPGSVKGTRSDRFFLKAAQIAIDAGPGVQVRAVLIGDGWSEGSTKEQWIDVREKLSKLKNFRGAWIGVASGAFEEIESEMGPLLIDNETSKEPKKIYIYGDLHNLEVDTVIEELRR
jgi:hypothetical protein